MFLEEVLVVSKYVEYVDVDNVDADSNDLTLPVISVS